MRGCRKVSNAKETQPHASETHGGDTGQLLSRGRAVSWRTQRMRVGCRVPCTHRGALSWQPRRYAREWAAARRTSTHAQQKQPMPMFDTNGDGTCTCCPCAGPPLPPACRAPSALGGAVLGGAVLGTLYSSRRSWRRSPPAATARLRPGERLTSANGACPWGRWLEVRVSVRVRDRVRVS
jgi:hypothetical protein